MRLFAIVLGIVLLMPASLLGAWWLINNTSPGSVGTPSHAGVVSQGRLEECKTIEMAVNPRSSSEAKVLLGENQVVRGTFEADGALGGSDIIMRVLTPNSGELLVSPRASNYDFVFPAEIPGEYTFVFDNRYSLITPKAVGFFYCVPP